MHIRFEHAASRSADLLIGADGLHSRVRSLTFGPERGFEVPLGYHVAAFEVTGYRPRDELVFVTYGVPGRQISRFALRDDRTLFLCIFRDEYLPASRMDASTDEERRKTIRRIFGGLGWESARIVAAMDDASEIYFDTVSQIRLPRWTSGRTALVGDAAACVSLLAGEGTGLAMAEAYMLAAALAKTSDHTVAFADYERRLRPFLVRKQRSAERFASSFVPESALGLRFRDLVTRFLRFRFVADWFITRDLRDAIELPPMPGVPMRAPLAARR